MNYRELYKEELSQASTNYFILDTVGAINQSDKEHVDIDFEEYQWNTDRYNMVKEKDLFIYRRQQKASEIVGQFYFFGAGRIEQIKKLQGTGVDAVISKPYIFNKKILSLI